MNNEGNFNDDELGIYGTDDGGLNDVEFTPNDEAMAAAKSIARNKKKNIFIEPESDIFGQLRPEKKRRKVLKLKQANPSQDISGESIAVARSGHKAYLERFNEDNDMYSEGENGQTVQDHMWDRIEASGTNLQLRVRRVLMGGDISGATPEARERSREAVQKFEETVGMKADKFLAMRQLDKNTLPSEITHTVYAEDGATSSEVKFPAGVASSADDYTVLSMLGKTAHFFTEYGSVYGQANRYQSLEQEVTAEERLVKAVNLVDRFASMAMGEVTGSKSFVDARKREWTEAITKELMDGRGSWSDFVPLPNDLGVLGGIVTKSFNPHGRTEDEIGNSTYQGIMGTPYNTRQFSDIEGELTQDEYWNLKPSFKSTYFPIASKNKLTKIYGESTALNMINSNDLIAEEFRKEVKEARETFIAQMPNNADESAGRGRTEGFYSVPFEGSVLQLDGSVGAVASEQSMKADYYNIAAELGLSRHGATLEAETIKGFTGDVEAGKGLNGTSSGGMHGEKELSQVQEFVQAKENGLSDEDAYASAIGEYNYKPKDVVKANNTLTDYDKYLLDQENKSDPRQGSAEWLLQRKGKVTGSIIGGASGEVGKNRLAYEIAREELGRKGSSTWRGNSYTAAGNTFEPAVLRSFLAKNPDLIHAEATFVQHKFKKEFGASPDGVLFDKNTGKRKGLLELKSLKDSRLDGAVKLYYDQVQWQMYNTGDTETRLYAMATDSERVVQEAIVADPEYQEMLAKRAQQTLKIAAKASSDEGLEELRYIINNKVKSKASTGVSMKTPSGQSKSYMEERGIDSYIGEDIDRPKSFEDAVSRTNHPVTVKNDLLMASKEGKDINEYRLKTMDEVHEEGINMNAQKDKSGRARASLQIKAQGEMDKDFISREKAASDELVEAKNRETEATKEATETLKTIGKNALVAGKALAKMAGAGTQSSMDTIERAAEAGMYEKEFRGLENILAEGGAGIEGAKEMTAQASQLVSTFTSADKTAKWFGDAQVKLALTNRKFGLQPSMLGNIKDLPKNTKDVINYILDLTSGLKPDAAKALAGALGVNKKFITNLASSTGISEAIDRSIDRAGTFAAVGGQADFNIKARRADELVGSTNREGGYLQALIAKSAEGPSGIVNSSSVAALDALEFGSEFGLQNLIRDSVNGKESKSTRSVNLMPEPAINRETGQANPQQSVAAPNVYVDNTVTIADDAITVKTTDSTGNTFESTDSLNTSGGTD